MADVIYNSFKTDLLKNNVDLEIDTFKIMLVTSAYIPDQDLHAKLSDITNEVVGTGYVAGGATLTGTAVSQDNTNNRAAFDADDVVWLASTITAAGAIIYKSRGGVATADELLIYLDFGGDEVSNNGDFTISFSTLGVFVLL